MSEIRYEVRPVVSDVALNDLFAAAWMDGSRHAFSHIHSRSLAYVCAFDAERLVGYVNVAWDGGMHAFLLNPTVHPDVRQRGIGTELVRRAVAVARAREAKWVHVDFDPALNEFYRRCGFTPATAGLIDLRPEAPAPAAAQEVPSRLPRRTAGRVGALVGAFAVMVFVISVSVTFVGAELSARSPTSLVVNVQRVIATPVPTPAPTPTPLVPFEPTPGDGVALTFDDGPDPAWTPRVLDILDQYGVKATFFVIGRSAAKYPDLVRSIVARGHAVGGHTWTHRKLTALSEAGWRSEVEETNRFLEELTGRPVSCVRPPGGHINAHALDQLERRNLHMVKWTLDTRDWTKPGSAAIVGRVAGGLHPGAIVLMHDGGGWREQTMVALPKVLDVIKAAGLAVKPIC